MINAVIAVLVVLIVSSGLTVTLVSFFRLQRHKADAAAMTSYRALAEQSAAQQQALQDQLETINERVAAVEKLLRSVE